MDLNNILKGTIHFGYSHGTKSRTILYHLVLLSKFIDFKLKVLCFITQRTKQDCINEIIDIFMKLKEVNPNNVFIIILLISWP